MDEYSQDMQKLLLKKEQEYGQLKFISSRATKETSCFIDELLEAIVDIIKKYNLFPEDNNHNKIRTITFTSAQCYNYFLLNTNFSSHHLLLEDLLYGHLVGIWPILSPYLFIQVIHILLFNRKYLLDILKICLINVIREYTFFHIL